MGDAMAGDAAIGKVRVRRVDALLLVGPTCSGKSALALHLAQWLGGAVINADAMQCYRELRVLTARPSAADEALVPHLLYGVRPAAEPGSAAWWREAALAAIAQVRAAGRLPILCGGTGLYFSTLLRGLADIPDPGQAARAEARGLLAELGAPALHGRLAAVDPASAARLAPGDGQRIARAWEVWRGTGRGLAAWQAQPNLAPFAGRVAAIRLDPTREELRTAIAGRFAAMLAGGAQEEMRALLAQQLDPALPLMRAHGVPELAACLRGEIDLATATARAELATSQYTKRQGTWFRHHELADPSHTHMIHARFADLSQFSEQNYHELQNFIRDRVDAAA
jgi:tRNA dimethylallyltransferase